MKGGVAAGVASGSGGRGEKRSDGRGEKRSDGRGEKRSDGRGEKRSGGRDEPTLAASQAGRFRASTGEGEGRVGEDEIGELGGVDN